MVAIGAHSDAQEADLRWWKGNIHTHSLWSDGNDFPEMIADWYKSHGYHFLALSDHNILSEGERWMKHDEIVKRGGEEALAKYRKRFGDEWVETRGTPDTPDYEVRLQPLDKFRKLLEEPDRFLMIQGEEISDKAEGVPVHMNATNIEKLIEPLGGRTVAEAIDNNLRAAEEQARQTGREILVHLNHPNFGYAITAEDLAAVIRERFVEVYNGHGSVNHLGDEHRASVEQIWDIANTIRLGQLDAPPLFGVANRRQSQLSRSKGALLQAAAGSWCGRQSWSPKRSSRQSRPATSTHPAASRSAMCATMPPRKLLQLEIQADEGVEYTTQFIGTKVGYDQALRAARRCRRQTDPHHTQVLQRYRPGLRHGERHHALVPTEGG